MAAKKNTLEDKARLDSNYQGNIHDPLNVANFFEEHAEFKHTNDQKPNFRRGGKENPILRVNVALY